MWRKSHQFTPLLFSLLLVVFVFCFLLDSVAQTTGELESDEVFDTTQAFGPGDVKEGYESADYTTQSRSLLDRRGKKQDLIQNLQDPPLGLPTVAVPAYNQPNRLQIELGRKLFFDKRLSINNTVSLSLIHI